MKHASATPEKRKSRPLGKFLIYIQEDENGHIWIQADSIGSPGKAFDLGCEIMTNLLACEAQNPTQLTVGDLMTSAGVQ
jgi:hypothetical protein